MIGDNKIRGDFSSRKRNLFLCRNFLSSRRLLFGNILIHNIGEIIINKSTRTSNVY